MRVKNLCPILGTTIHRGRLVVVSRLLVIVTIIVCLSTPVFAMTWHRVDDTYSFSSDELVVNRDSRGRLYAVAWIRQTWEAGKKIGEWNVFNRISRECLYLEDKTMATVENYLLDSEGKIVRKYRVPFYQRVETSVKKDDPIYKIWVALNNYWVDLKFKETIKHF